MQINKQYGEVLSFGAQGLEDTFLTFKSGGELNDEDFEYAKEALAKMTEIIGRIDPKLSIPS